jgi:hypothetical protein
VFVRYDTCVFLFRSRPFNDMAAIFKDLLVLIAVQLVNQWVIEVELKSLSKADPRVDLCWSEVLWIVEIPKENFDGVYALFNRQCC